MAQDTSSEQTHVEGVTTGEAIALGVGLAWIGLVGLFFWLLPEGAINSISDDRLLGILMIVSVVVPVGMIWLAVMMARHARVARAEAFRTQTALDHLRQMQLAQQAIITKQAAEPSVEKKLTEIAQSAKNTEAAVAGFTSRREVSRLIVPRAAPQVPADQPTLALGTSSEDMTPPLERADYVRALNFPDDEHDTEGFAALRRALKDRTARRLVQASQDVLTLLSQDGIYMDDLRPGPVPADLWRRFAQGERGNDMDRLGAIRDRSSLALAAGRMREDTIFRDSVHHFLRRFDEMLVTFEENATDTDLLALAETRTARAFMVLARATGTFD
ncbi:MAG: hypothetical protein ACSHW1_04600 [Yoonia sp.]|uniref:hypothetical protein n=1 Tax=Yoonia sp. TaxID=2212373 RepID=UPI003EF3C1CC